MKPKSPKTKSTWSGIYAALVTPMKSDEEIDYPKLAAFTDHLIRQGVHGLIPLGSTGEYYALTADERERVIRTTLEAAAGRVPVVAGTNAGSTRDVIAFSRQAEALGCAGVMLAAPYYSLPRLEELFVHFKAVDQALGIPIMLYNYPGRTGVDMPPEFIERLAGLKNLHYVKESTGEMPRITELLRRCGDRLGVFCGCDTIALESLMVGALGWVGGVVNVLPASHAKLYELTVGKQHYPAARKLFFEMLPTLELMEGGGKYTQWVKAACGLMGHDCGAPRRPLGPATKAEKARLQTALRECAEGRRD
ncbi:MAG: 4-hydroxy-tetrahydrodipicolinate synthase [Limisphaerales bacterium]